MANTPTKDYLLQPLSKLKVIKYFDKIKTNPFDHNKDLTLLFVFLPMIFPASNNEQNTDSTPSPRVYKVYPRRFPILIIFCLCSLLSSFQWIEYVIIQNIIIRYYNQSLPESYDAKNNAVTWTSLSYMVIE